MTRSYLKIKSILYNLTKMTAQKCGDLKRVAVVVTKHTHWLVPFVVDWVIEDLLH